MRQTTADISPTDIALSEGDPRRGFATAVALGGAAVANVVPSQLDGPTPCTEFTVRDLLGHLVYVLRRVSALGRGEDITGVQSTSGIGDTEWTDTWKEAALEVLTAWSGPDVLDRTMILPFGELSGAAAIAVYIGEVTIHTWDLATATDQRPEWDDGTVATALVAYRRALPAARPPGVPFGPAVAIDDDRPLIEVLAAWSGRRP
jgi:uncharacterized protein (TIGR03086 family)